MSAAGVGSVSGATGSGYDFTNMTNKQFLSAVKFLEADGKISQTDADQLGAIAEGVDSVPISGPSPSVQQILNDTSSHDFISELQNIHSSIETNLGSVGDALYSSMLSDLEANEGSQATQVASLSETA
jgi:hypothetical protein